MVRKNFYIVLLIAITSILFFTVRGNLQNKIYFKPPFDDIRRKIENISSRIEVVDYRTNVESWFVVLLMADVESKFVALLDGQMSIWALDNSLVESMKTHSRPNSNAYIHSLEDFNSRMTFLEAKSYNIDEKEKLYEITERVKKHDDLLQKLQPANDLPTLSSIEQRVNSLQAQDILGRLGKLEKRFDAFISSLVSTMAVNELEKNLILLEERVSAYKQKLHLHHLPHSCREALHQNHDASGIYKIAMDSYHRSLPFSVYCDSDHGGDWMVVQRRMYGNVDFYRRWDHYQHGFGDLNTDFFVGLDKLHVLTATIPPPELLIVLRNYHNQTKVAYYSSFVIGDEYEAYALKELGHYNGTAGDSLRAHVNSKFSTRDNDHTTKHCARKHKGAWWFKECLVSHLNAPMVKMTSGEDGIQWKSFNRTPSSLQFVQIMLRPSLE